MRYRIILQKTSLRYIAVCFMAVSVILRSMYFLPRWAQIEPLALAFEFFLPLLSCAIYAYAMLAKGGRLYLLTVLAVFFGVLFFIIKAQNFAYAWHTALCTLLYLLVFMLYILTALGVLPSLLPQKLVLGLPLAFHIGQDLLFPSANMATSVLLEFSVLCIMSALLSGTFALRLEKINDKR
ncbi:MAG: hypothetical protein VB049_03550 [Candidatus Pelethousia sp.]|nr:hypothetical protein [Candidatus Pelethousia sp.]